MSLLGMMVCTAYSLHNNTRSVQQCAGQPVKRAHFSTNDSLFSFLQPRLRYLSVSGFNDFPILAAPRRQEVDITTGACHAALTVRFQRTRPVYADYS
jgi:hypothetical protein